MVTGGLPLVVVSVVGGGLEAGGVEPDWVPGGGGADDVEAGGTELDLGGTSVPGGAGGGGGFGLVPVAGVVVPGVPLERGGRTVVNVDDTGVVAGVPGGMPIAGGVVTVTVEGG